MIHATHPGQVAFCHDIIGREDDPQLNTAEGAVVMTHDALDDAEPGRERSGDSLLTLHHDEGSDGYESEAKHLITQPEAGSRQVVPSDSGFAVQLRSVEEGAVGGPEVLYREGITLLEEEGVLAGHQPSHLSGDVRVGGEQPTWAAWAGGKKVWAAQHPAGLFHRRSVRCE